MIVANADFIGGFGLWVDSDHLLHHTYSFLGVETYKQVATEPLPPGEVSVRDALRVRPAAARQRRHGDPLRRGPGGRRWHDAAHHVPIAFTSYAGMDISRDNGLVVDLDYEDKAPYAFTGRVKKVTFDLAPVSHEEDKALHQHAANHAVGDSAAG